MAHSPGRSRAALSALARPESRLFEAMPAVNEAFSEIDGTSSQMRALKRDMRRVAQDAFVTVLIQGESGTGKERVASAIHEASPRRHAPFVIVDCAGLSPTLVEDELFGHVRGAFTGAVTDQPGPFERANGGTVFLDEIGELTPELQIKLLRALQQRTVRRLGGTHETGFDVRVIVATNIDLARAVARRRFREDLYYRLKVYELHVPPLRCRGSADIEALVHAILNRLSARRNAEKGLTLDPSVLELFVRYRWPGNIRELENVLERMLVAAERASILGHAHLPDDFAATCLRTQAGAHMPATPTRLPSVDEARATLERNGFVCERAAAQLGLSRHQLYRILKRYGLSVRGRATSSL